MTRSELNMRLAALDLAIKTAGIPCTQVIKQAKEYYEFISKNTKSCTKK